MALSFKRHKKVIRYYYLPTERLAWVQVLEYTEVYAPGVYWRNQHVWQ